MNLLDRRWAPLAAALALAACGSSGPDLPPIVDCSTASATMLVPGETAIIDASKQGCLSLPAAGPDGADYLYFAGITDGSVSATGSSVPYQLYGAPAQAAAAAVTRVPPPLASLRQSEPARAFHARLRRMEREAARESLARGPAALRQAAAAVPPPVPGDKRSFNVLASGSSDGTKPGDYVQVTATAQYVGSHAAVYLDDAAPSPTYSPDDIQSIGTMFDGYLYPIDTTAFGRESDIDQNGLVLILLTDRVTKIVPCNGTSQVIGFFLPFDLSPAHVGSNAGEVFYGLVPDASCNVSVDDARLSLPPVVIHEFQHMISYNQHVLIRGGGVEETWLNEGLSSLAEELGGRQVPDALCQNNDCLTEFALIDLDNARRYLSDPVGNYLIGPDRIPIPLEEYGSGWLFVRWLLDHYATTATLGTDLSRKLDATSRTGEDNVVTATGGVFSALVMHWQLANYLDDLPGFTPADPLDQYISWNFRDAYASLHASLPGMFPTAFPLEPPVATDGRFEDTGTLLAGSGRHLLVEQSANAPSANLALTESNGSSALPAGAAPFVGVVRIR